MPERNGPNFEPIQKEVPLVCSFCPKQIGTKIVTYYAYDERITQEKANGICDDCKDKEFGSGFGTGDDELYRQFLTGDTSLPTNSSQAEPQTETDQFDVLSFMYSKKKTSNSQ